MEGGRRRKNGRKDRGKEEGEGGREEEEKE